MAGLYERLYSAFQKRYNSQLSKKLVQQKCNETWRQLKDTHLSPIDLKKATEDKVRELNEEGTRRSASFLKYFAQVSDFFIKIKYA